MTKMKKLFAVVLALAMLVTMSSFSASAEGTTSVDMTIATTQTNVVKVVIDADETVVGGLTATLNYDKEAVKYVGVEGYDEDANLEANTVKDDKNGAIAIVLLGSDLIVNFEFVGGASAVTFELTNIAASNLDGTAKLSADDVTKTLSTVIAEGNTIRNTNNVEKQDLGFVSTFIGAAVPEGATDVYLGFLAIPTAMLKDDVELEVGAYDSALNSLVKVDRDAIVAEGATEYIAHITGFLQGNADNGYDYSRMGRKISGRFYVTYKLNGAEKTVYSTNNSTSPVVVNGKISRSFVGTCKAMATAILNSGMSYNYTEELGSDDAVQTILDDPSTNDEQKANILKFVIENAEILEQLEAH